MRYLKRTASLLILTIFALALNASAAVCPGTYFKNTKTQALSIPLFNYWYQDIDGDGLKDMLGLSAPYNVAGPNSIVFYKRSANGFDTPPVVTSLGANFLAKWVGPGDMNGDGKKDIVTFTFEQPTVNDAPVNMTKTYFNNGSGVFIFSGPITQFPSNRVARYDMADLNGDGRDDLFLQDGDGLSSQLWYMLSQPSGQFQQPAVNLGSNLYDPVVGNLDNSGANDIMTFFDPSFMGQISNSVFVNNGQKGPPNFSFVNSAAAKSPAVALGDFNSDSFPDGVSGLYPSITNNNQIVFSLYPRNPQAGNYYRVDKASGITPAFLLSNYFDPPQVGRFNDDLVKDIVFFGKRSYIIEEYDNLTSFSEKIYSPPASGIAEDFSGDGKADLVSLRYSALSNNGNSVESISFLQNVCDRPGQTKYVDFDHDGQTDMGSWRASDGRWRWRGVDGISHDFNWGLGSLGDVPVAQDYDGDGQTDYAVYRNSTGVWYVYRSSDAQVFIMAFGLPGDRPVPADFDGDGKADLGIYRPSTGNWYFWQSGSNSLFAANFGLNGDIPLPMDYDGDGKADLAVFRPSNGTWYEWRSGDLSYYIVNFGLNGDKPVPADYDSDGKADIAVFRDGIWYMLRSRNNGFFAIQFGSTGDVPFATYNTASGRGTSLTVFRPSNSAIFDYLITSYIYSDMAGNRIISSILPID